MEIYKEWKEIKKYPGYFASSDGEIKGPRKILKQQDFGHGYRHVPIQVSGKSQMKHVARLVLFAFHPIDNPEKYDAAHLNGIRHDNRLANLTWATKKENSLQLINHGRQVMGGRCAKAKLTETQVQEIYLDYWLSKCSLREIGKKYNIDKTNVSSIGRHKTWKHLKLWELDLTKT